MRTESVASKGPRRVLAAAVAGLCVALAAGCASTPVPSQELASAAEAVDRAERAGARQAAPGELTGARDKLARAQSMAEDDAETAIRLAEQARADAELAAARAEALRASNALNTVNESLEALREEANRPLGAPVGGSTPLPPTGAPAGTSTPPATTAPGPVPAQPPPDGGSAVANPLIAGTR